MTAQVRNAGDIAALAKPVVGSACEPNHWSTAIPRASSTHRARMLAVRR
jgi:hypothetical protein